MGRRAVLALALLTGCAGGVAPTAPAPPSVPLVRAANPPVVAGCHMFPANNPWNTDISHDPVDPKSATYIAHMPGNLHADFGNTPGYGIPFNVVPANQKKVPISFAYSSESDPGPYPIPPNAYIEGWPHPSSDRHVLVLQQGTCTLYEVDMAYEHDGGKRWTGISGAIFHLNSNKLRPNGWTSADAAGLPMTQALVKCAEVRAGAIDHALRFSVGQTQRGFIHPATHFASSSSDPDLPPMGLRVRLKASFDISRFNRVSQIILTAMKTYGMLLADNGGSWYFSGQGGPQESCWRNSELNQLKTVPSSAFEVVKTGPILHV